MLFKQYHCLQIYIYLTRNQSSNKKKAQFKSFTQVTATSVIQSNLPKIQSVDKMRVTGSSFKLPPTQKKKRKHKRSKLKRKENGSYDGPDLIEKFTQGLLLQTQDVRSLPQVKKVKKQQIITISEPQNGSKTQVPSSPTMLQQQPLIKQQNQLSAQTLPNIENKGQTPLSQKLELQMKKKVDLIEPKPNRTLMAVERKFENDLKRPFIKADLRTSKELLLNVGIEMSEQEENRMLQQRLQVTKLKQLAGAKSSSQLQQLKSGKLQGNNLNLEQIFLQLFKQPKLFQTINPASQNTRMANLKTPQIDMFTINSLRAVKQEIETPLYKIYSLSKYFQNILIYFHLL